MTKGSAKRMNKKIVVINFSASLMQDDYMQLKNKNMKNKDIYYYSTQKKSLVSYLSSKFPEVYIELIGLNTNLSYSMRWYKKCRLVQLPNLSISKIRIIVFNSISFLYLLFRHKPSIIYAYTDGKLYPYLGALFYAKLLKVPLFIDFRNPPRSLRLDASTSLYKKMIIRAIDNICMINSNKIIHISEKSRHLLKSNPKLYKKSIVVPSCSQNIFASRKRKNMKDERLSFAYWGVMAKDRRIDTVIQGFAKAKTLNNKFDAQFFLIGSGDDITHLKKLVQELNAPGIIFKDYMNQKELYEFLQEISVAVIPIPPDKFYQYSSPLKLAEAIAMGLPIIATDIEPNQIVKEYDLGIVCDHDEDSYARAFLEFFMFSDLDRFREGCNKVKHLFMPETVFKELGEEIGRFINR